MKKMLAALVVLLVAVAFVAGYWPQHQELVRARAETAEARRQLEEARSTAAASETRARLGRVFGQYLALKDAVVTGNFGEAQALSTALFDRVREEAGQTEDATVRTALDAVLMRRDAVTAGLARGEGSVSDVLSPVEREPRRARGYPVPPLAPASAVPPEARP